MFKIAIDGPAGAGKSTISKIVANRLNYLYIDTGAMYRAITYKALQLGIDMEDDDAYGFLASTEIAVDGGKVFIDGKDVSDAIRTVEVTTNVSTPSKIGCVRSWLVNYQRSISESQNVVMDGRDIGTVVLPNADLKIYLDATPECRAKRRMLERAEAGLIVPFEETLAEIKLRDHKDSTRAISPLKVAENAIVIDSSEMTIEEVVTAIINLVNERGSKKMSKLSILEGQEVKGTITNVTKEAIYLIIGEDQKAVIYNNDMTGYIEGQKLRDFYFEGGEFTGLVKQVAKDAKTSEPLYILSTKLYQARDQIKVFDELKENDEIIQAKVTNVSRIGADLVYKDFKDIKLFLPIKNIDLREEALRGLKNQMLDVVITYVNHDRIQVTVSNVIAMNKKARLARVEAMNKLSVGMEVEGTVVNVLEFGAIVDLGGVSGLLHRTELDHKLVRNVNDYVKNGDVIKVKIIKMEDGKIGLSKKALTPHPWEILKEQYHVGDTFDGVVKKIIPAGLIIGLTEQYSGLMPRSEYSWFINERMDDKVKEGDSIKVKVLDIDDTKKRISLSHRATIENAWSDVKVRRGDTIEVTIKSIEERGAQVAYNNVPGYLPINEVTSQKRIAKVDEIFKVGEKVEVSVVECDPARAKLVVSAKALETAKERAEFDKYFKQQADEMPTNTIADVLGDSLDKFKK